MPIPTRLQLVPPSDKLVREMCTLCDAIEQALTQHDDPTELLERWHTHTTRQCNPSEFTSYWKATDQEEFVREVLYPRPTYLEDLQYDEARAVLEAVSKAKLAEAESSYFLDWLETQFPNSNMSDLIYWPDEWFGDASLFRESNGAFKPEAELSLDQTLAYAMRRSSRVLPGAPSDVELPFPMPDG